VTLASTTLDWDAFDAEVALLARGLGFLPAVSSGTPFHAWHRAGMGRRIYLSAGIHGDEPAGPLAILHLLRAGDLFTADHDWTLCPALNPHGLRAGTRENAHGIDLNRDYQRRTSAEAAAHAAWLLNRQPPDLFLSLHEDWETTGFYFYEINLHDDQPARAQAILAAASATLPIEAGPLIDGHEVRAPGWIHHAAEADLPDDWPEAIFLAKNGCPLSFTFETPSTAATLDARVEAHVAAIRQVLAF
jgi:predicted deacylase